jgi:hypothetical protein
MKEHGMAQRRRGECTTNEEAVELFKKATRIDATEPYCITLIRRDVVTGVSRDPYNCAFHRGMERDPHVLACRFGATIAEVIFTDEPDSAYRYELGEKAVRMIHAFDDVPEKVRDIADWAHGVEIRLNVPPPSRRFGGRPGGKKKDGPGTTKRPKRAPLRSL